MGAPHQRTRAAKRPRFPTPALPDGAGGRPADQSWRTSASSLFSPVSRVEILQKFCAPDAAKPRWRRGFGERMDGAGKGEARRGRGEAWAECGRLGACRKMGLLLREINGFAPLIGHPGSFLNRSKGHQFVEAKMAAMLDVADSLVLRAQVRQTTLHSASTFTAALRNISAFRLLY